MQDILALAGVTTKLLAKKLTHVGFVVHNHDADAHYTASAAAARPLRGSRTVNSVKSPTAFLLGARSMTPMGHQEWFSPSRLSASCGLRLEMIAAMRRKGRDARIPDLPALALA